VNSNSLGFALGWSSTFRLPCAADKAQSSASTFGVGHATKAQAIVWGGLEKPDRNVIMFGEP